MRAEKAPRRPFGYSKSLPAWGSDYSRRRRFGPVDDFEASCPCLPLRETAYSPGTTQWVTKAIPLLNGPTGGPRTSGLDSSRSRQNLCAVDARLFHSLGWQPPCQQPGVLQTEVVAELGSVCSDAPPIDRRQYRSLPRKPTDLDPSRTKSIPSNHAEPIARPVLSAGRASPVSPAGRFRTWKATAQGVGDILQCLPSGSPLSTQPVSSRRREREEPRRPSC